MNIIRESMLIQPLITSYIILESDARGGVQTSKVLLLVVGGVNLNVVHNVLYAVAFACN
jgi:hypothetical protein